MGDHVVATGDGHIDTDDWVSHAAFDIIGLATFGHDLETITRPGGLFAKTYRKMLSPNRWSLLLGFLIMFLPAWFWWLIP